MANIIGACLGGVGSLLQQIFNPEQAQKDGIVKQLMQMGAIGSQDEVKGQSLGDLKQTLQQAMADMTRPDGPGDGGQDGNDDASAA